MYKYKLSLKVLYTNYLIRRFYTKLVCQKITFHLVRALPPEYILNVIDKSLSQKIR